MKINFGASLLTAAALLFRTASSLPFDAPSSNKALTHGESHSSCDANCTERLIYDVAYSACASGAEQAMLTYHAVEWCAKTTNRALCNDTLTANLSALATEAAASSGLKRKDYAACDDVCLLSALAEVSSRAALWGMRWAEKVFADVAGVEPGEEEMQRLRWSEWMVTKPAPAIDRAALHDALRRGGKVGASALRHPGQHNGSGTGAVISPLESSPSKLLGPYMDTSSDDDENNNDQKHLAAILGAVPVLFGSKSFLAFLFAKAILPPRPGAAEVTFPQWTTDPGCGGCHPVDPTTQTPPEQWTPPDVPGDEGSQPLPPPQPEGVEGGSGDPDLGPGQDPEVQEPPSDSPDGEEGSHGPADKPSGPGPDGETEPPSSPPSPQEVERPAHPPVDEGPIKPWPEEQPGLPPQPVDNAPPPSPPSPPPPQRPQTPPKPEGDKPGGDPVGEQPASPGPEQPPSEQPAPAQPGPDSHPPEPEQPPPPHPKLDSRPPSPERPLSEPPAPAHPEPDTRLPSQELPPSNPPVPQEPNTRPPSPEQPPFAPPPKPDSRPSSPERPHSEPPAPPPEPAKPANKPEKVDPEHDEPSHPQQRPPKQPARPWKEPEQEPERPKPPAPKVKDAPPKAGDSYEGPQGTHLKFAPRHRADVWDPNPVTSNRAKSHIANDQAPFDRVDEQGRPTDVVWLKWNEVTKVNADWNKETGPKNFDTKTKPPEPSEEEKLKVDTKPHPPTAPLIEDAFPNRRGPQPTPRSLNDSPFASWPGDPESNPFAGYDAAATVSFSMAPIPTPTWRAHTHWDDVKFPPLLPPPPPWLDPLPPPRKVEDPPRRVEGEGYTR